MGWGFISDLQADTFGDQHDLVEFDPGAGVDVALFWQQWKLSSPTLDEIASVVRAHAEARLR
jgi:LysR family transcriptional regulator, chromosome initiation inhibitor